MISCWRREPLGRMPVSNRTGILVSSCKSPGLATLLRWRKPKFPTLLSPSPTTFEAARMQHSLAVNAGTPDTPEPDRGADLEPPPHDTPPPVEVAETPDHPPGQIRAPTDVGKPLKLLRGETSLRTMGQMGMTPIGEAHGCPPDPQ